VQIIPSVLPADCKFLSASSSCISSRR
jgi:hypothetical protein